MSLAGKWLIPASTDQRQDDHVCPDVGFPDRLRFWEQKTHECGICLVPETLLHVKRRENMAVTRASCCCCTNTSAICHLQTSRRCDTPPPPPPPRKRLKRRKPCEFRFQSLFEKTQKVLRGRSQSGGELQKSPAPPTHRHVSSHIAVIWSDSGHQDVTQRPEPEEANC